MRKALVIWGLLSACETKPPPAIDASAPPPPPPPSVVAPLKEIKEASAPVVIAPVDAGPSACKIVFGPTEQSFAGPATLLADGTIVGNDAGKPKTWTPASPKTDRVTVKWPACAVADKRAFCMNATGTITRTTLAGENPKVIAKARPNTRVTAAKIGEHAVVAWLESHRTTEGEQLQAFAAMDEEAPMRLSEDGAGATSVQLVEQGTHATAVYLDTRSAMVPIHARPLFAEGGKLAPKTDTVLHVAGAPERGIDFTLAASGGTLVMLLPTSKDTIDFGVAAFAIADPPAGDVDPVWSMYPNGLDPAPIAATHGGKSMHVLRVRPAEKAPGAPRVVELGSIDAKGAFTSLGTVGDGKRVTDVAIAEGENGLWILYGDNSGSWLERRACP